MSRITHYTKTWSLSKDEMTAFVIGRLEITTPEYIVKCIMTAEEVAEALLLKTLKYCPNLRDEVWVMPIIY